jgi:hypothetical protein
MISRCSPRLGQCRPRLERPTHQVHDDLAITSGNERDVPVLQSLDEVLPVVDLSVDSTSEVLLSIGVDQGLSSRVCPSRVHPESATAVPKYRSIPTVRSTHRHRRWRDVRDRGRSPFRPRHPTNRVLDNAAPWTFSRIWLEWRRDRRWLDDNLGYRTWLVRLCFGSDWLFWWFAKIGVECSRCRCCLCTLSCIFDPKMPTFPLSRSLARVTTTLSRKRAKPSSHGSVQAAGWRGR